MIETIEVRYAFIDHLPAGVIAFHKYIIYTNSSGQQFRAEAVPTNKGVNDFVPILS
ncbi:MAG: hypothetical protein NTV00_02505 [Methylococcales bacterium]|nr:hypothetical protein [Methylococcales bacterium]